MRRVHTLWARFPHLRDETNLVTRSHKDLFTSWPDWREVAMDYVRGVSYGVDPVRISVSVEAA